VITNNSHFILLKSNPRPFSRPFKS
jgi:hypothetical protein